MDDGADRGDSRAPHLEDIVKLCKALNAQGARYLLIGGFAVILHGFVRTTKDVGLLVDPSVGNMTRVKRALAILPDNAAAMVEDDDVQRCTVVRVADEIVVDLLASAGGITYDAAVQDGVETFEIEGVPVPVATKETLIKMKQTVRESDAVDVRYLRLRIEEERAER